MAEWIPMFVLPNVLVHQPIEVPGMALVPAFDPRIKALAKQHKNYGLYLRRFRNEFGARVNPSTIIVWDEAPISYRKVDAIGSFRDLVALSAIPHTWARLLEFGAGQDGPQYSNSFAFYPWMLDKDYKYLAVQSMATMGFQDQVKKMQGQTQPAISFCWLIPRMIDLALLNALLERWTHRYSTPSPTWRDRALFRSLNMANAAAALPAHAEITQYDLGRLVALWVSAFEILAHPPFGTQNGYKQVYALLESIRWRNSHCTKRIYSAYPHRRKLARKTLPCWIYGQLNGVRNDFIHGNRVPDDRLLTPRSQRSLLSYAPVLYRMALAAFLKLRWKERRPPKKSVLACNQYDERQFQFEAYQRATERAIESIKYTRQEWQDIKTGLLSPAIMKWP